MKKSIRIWCLVLSFLTIFCYVGCGNNKKIDIDEQSNKIDANTVSLSEDNFEWDGNVITALTDKGAKQTSLIIPERCEGFNGMIFADKENAVISVSFESDKDVDLNGVFGSAENIKTIILPAQLSEIGDLEFWLCSSLEEIRVPIGVTSIGAYAFQNNVSLKTVHLEGNVTSIMAHAFDGCSSLETINLVNSITLIEKYAFFECKALKEVTLPLSLSEVGDFAFANSGLTTLTIPSDVILDKYSTTSFAQMDHNVIVNITQDSWIDQNFNDVFDGAYIKSYQ